MARPRLSKIGGQRLWPVAVRQTRRYFLYCCSAAQPPSDPFTVRVLGPGGFLVLVSDYAAFQTRYPGVDVVFAPTADEMYPAGGTTVARIRTMGDSLATLARGQFASHPGALELEARCGVPASLLELPIGLSNTDAFIDALRLHGTADVPLEIEEERGRLLDLMGDLVQYLHGKRVAVEASYSHGYFCEGGTLCVRIRN